MSAGQLRQDLGVLPPGDLVKQLAAVSNAPDWKIKLWRKRFGREIFKAGHKGHTFGNLFLAGIEHTTGSFAKALREAEAFLEIENHRAYPATVDNIHLCAELENGEVIVGEDEIDEPEKHDSNLKIKRVFLKPVAKAFPPLLKEIANASLITFGPGDFYSSVVPCLLPVGIAKALKKSKAKKIFICNTVNKLGETHGFTLENYASEIEKYMGCPLDYLVYQDPAVTVEKVLELRRNKADLAEPVAVAAFLSNKFVGADISEAGNFPYHPQKIRKVINKLIKYA